LQIAVGRFPEKPSKSGDCISAEWLIGDVDFALT
jgi:hypothetical protein